MRREVFFSVIVFYKERFSWKQSSLFPYPLLLLEREWVAWLEVWGRGPGHLQLHFCPSLVFEVCLQKASVLRALSHSVNLGLVAWPWAWGLVNHKPVTTVTCPQMTAPFPISLVEIKAELGSSLYLSFPPPFWKTFHSIIVIIMKSCTYSKICPF